MHVLYIAYYIILTKAIIAHMHVPVVYHMVTHVHQCMLVLVCCSSSLPALLIMSLLKYFKMEALLHISRLESVREKQIRLTSSISSIAAVN